ncbi:MAG TPA: RimK family alpha-L-glutamate ligase [Clostridiales bacterium]|nr:RimK family alpha-L-glutamate ligase [Clostridiales bacterium]
MAGYVIYNGFWNPGQPPDTVTRLVKAAELRGIRLTPLANTETAVELDGGVKIHGFDASDFVLFFDKDIRLARALETIGVRVYNPAEVIAACDDKAATHLKLAAEGIPMPATLVAPMTYLNFDESPGSAFLKTAAKKLGFPLVVKECYGSLGGQVYLARDEDELLSLSQKMKAKPFICQKFISSSAGADIRVYVVDGEPVAAMRRQSNSDFRANVGLGAVAKPYSPTPEEAALAVECCKILGALFAGVDILTEADGSPLICEVNSNAQVTAITECTGVDVAAAIIDMVLSREKQR